LLPRLDYIKQARVRLGVSQRRLADLSSISTSMINQIESGRCKPSYETARRIFDALASLEGKSAMKAGDICSRALFSIQKNEKLYKAIDLMRQHSISQLPVFESTQAVGVLTEDGVAKAVAERGEDIKDFLVTQVMDSPPPIVDVSTPAKALIPLVRFAKSVLVSEKGRVIGIVTITDTLKMIE
jgi:predicted transcriptional regulator